MRSVRRGGSRRRWRASASASWTVNGVMLVAGRHGMGRAVWLTKAQSVVQPAHQHLPCPIPAAPHALGAIADLELSVLPALEELEALASAPAMTRGSPPPPAAPAAPSSSGGAGASRGGSIEPPELGASGSGTGSGSSGDGGLGGDCAADRGAGGAGAGLLAGVEAEWLRATFPARRAALLADLCRTVRDRPSFKLKVSRSDVTAGVLDALSRAGGRGGGAATVLLQPVAVAFEGAHEEACHSLMRARAALLPSKTRPACPALR
jgi:hypothetical protein